MKSRTRSAASSTRSAARRNPHLHALGADRGPGRRAGGLRGGPGKRRAGRCPGSRRAGVAFGDQPVLIVIDELVLYMARAFALKEDQPAARSTASGRPSCRPSSGLPASRPQTVVILTLPSEQDANRKLTGELKQHIPTVLETVDEIGDTTARQARNLTPTQSNERAAVLGRRLFDSVRPQKAGDVAASAHRLLRGAAEGTACRSTAGPSSRTTPSRSASATRSIPS